MAESGSAPLNIFRTRPGSPDAFARSETLRWRLERYFQLSVFLLLTVGFVGIATTGALDFFSVALVSFALLVRGSLLIVGRKLSMPLAWDPYFTFGYVAFYGADYFVFSRSFVNATIHLVLFTMVVKIFSIRRDRDYVYLTVLAFMEVLAASVLTVDTIFLGSFVLFSLLAVNTFLAFEIRRTWTASASALPTFTSGSNVYAPRKFSRSLLGIALGLVLGIVLIASGIFFILPRMTAGYLSRFAPRNRVETGFSNDVQLGRIGEIQQSSAVAMHIEIEGDTTGAHDLRWRGITLASFDGHTWSNRLSPSEAIPELRGCFNVMAPDERRPGYTCLTSTASKDVIRYRVLMEPIGTPVFFVAPKVRSLWGRYRNVTVDTAGAVYNADLNRMIDAYEATSDISSPSPEQLRHSADFYPISITNPYTDLPPQIDGRIERLAKQVAGSATNPYDKAAAIEHYLQTNYGYTLQLPQTRAKDPVANFLFERKVGHCEYFASAMAVMLRSLGIPSRLVNGFRGGEFNDISGKYIVRASDAHSWVEVYFPGSGWVSFDPTPAGPGPTGIAHNQVALYLDAMRDFWREWIINYDVGHQATLANLGAAHALRNIDDARRWVKNHYFRMILQVFDLRNEVARRPGRWMYLSFVGAVLLLVVLNLPRIHRAIRRRRLARNPGSAPDAAASLWYVRMLALLKRKGLSKRPSQTPQEFTEGISEPGLRAMVALFVKHYERARFADSAADAEKLPSLFETVRTTARRP